MVRLTKVEEEQILKDAEPKKLDKNCQHEFKSRGYWDGKDKNGKWVAGKSLQCLKCKGWVYPRHGEEYKYLGKNIDDLV